MFAFLFDRRSGLQTGLLAAGLALLLFAGGVLVGLTLRWSREAVTEGVLHPLSLTSLVEEKVGSGAGAGSETTPPPSPEGEATPEDAAPMTEGAAPPDPSS